MGVVLIVGAHPDDAEIGLGGTIRRLLARGHRVAVVDLTDGEETPHGSREIRAAETEAANRALGLTERVCLGLPNRVLMDGEEPRRRLAAEIRRLRPDVVFAHAELDAHPDHVAAFAIARGAVLLSRIVKIDLPHEAWRPGPLYQFVTSHLRHAYAPAFVLEISREELEAKVAAVLAYASQFVVGRPEGWARETVETRARHDGALGGFRWGEPVLTPEPVGVRDLWDIAGAGRETREIRAIRP